MVKETTVTLSLAEFEQMKARMAALENNNAFLVEEVRILRHRLFGQKSEKWKAPEGLVSLFDEAEALANQPCVEEEPKVSVGPHERTAKKRKALPEEMPRIEVIHDLSEAEKFCPTDGTPLISFGREVSSKLDIIPATIQIVDNVRLKYKCPCCNDYVVTARAKPQAIPKSIATEGLLAHITAAKYQNSLPLHRQESIFREIGCELSRNLMAKWMMQCAELVTPLVDCLKAKLLEMPALHADETPVQVLKQPGKKPGSRGTMWVLAASAEQQKAVIFQFHSSRSGQAAQEVIGQYRGYLHIDGYDGYNALFTHNLAVRVGCMAHARRKFDEALKAGSSQGGELAKTALSYFARLYEVERKVSELPDEERKELRSNESMPLLLALKEWAEKALPTVPPKSKIGSALGYLLNEWPHLIRYCEEGFLKIDNNRAENAIRPFAVGRKNWLCVSRRSNYVTEYMLCA